MKIGIVVEGGGMKNAYSAGILDEMLKDQIYFDYCIGVSAGSANLASFVANQYGRNQRFYEVHNQSDQFLSLKSYFKCGNAFNLEYIYGTLTNSTGADPLDYETMMANPSELVIGATNANSGKEEYFYKYQLKKDHYLELMASCAIPAACKPVKIGENYYYDGGVKDGIPFDQAFKDGCDKVVVITNKVRGVTVEKEEHKWLYHLLCHKYPSIIKDLDNRHIMLNEQLEKMYQKEKEGKIFVFSPSELIVDTTTKDPKLEHQQYLIGVKDYHDLKEQLLAFIS